MSVFGEKYAEIYDALNEGKDYQFEVQYCLDAFSRYRGKIGLPNSVLDLACGSGEHLAQMGEIPIRVGVDVSQEMVDIARRKNTGKIDFVLSDINKLRLDQKFDLVTSLFHVLSYQYRLDSAVQYMRSISHHLEDHGLAIVDFWHRPAWKWDPPGTRERVIEFGNTKAVRTSKGTPDFLTGQVDVDISVNVSSENQSQDVFDEQHFMRAFTIAEVELLANIAGLKVIDFVTWAGIDVPIKADDWVCVALIEHEK